MSDPSANKPTYFAGIRVFLNPFLFIEMKEIPERNAPAAILILTTLEAYGAEQEHIAAYESAPKPSITFKETASWRKNTDHLGARHNFYKTPRGAQERKTPIKLFELSYFDVERIEHSDGTVLWQKKR